MKHNNILIVVAIILAGAAINLTNAATACQVCMSNGVYCINETSFYMCYGTYRDVVDKTTPLNCPTGQVCTGLNVICAPGDEIEPVCGESNCGSCGIGPFACTSRSTFAFCSSGVMSAVRGKCPQGLVCDVSSNLSNICVKPCKAAVICDIPDPII